MTSSGSGVVAAVVVVVAAVVVVAGVVVVAAVVILGFSRLDFLGVRLWSSSFQPPDCWCLASAADRLS